MMKYLAVAALLAVAAVFFQKVPVDFFFQKSDLKTTTLKSLTAKPDPNWLYIKSILDKKPETIADFLEELKKRNPSAFSSFVVVHNTRSKQKSSFLYPRAILFDFSRNRVMLSFNGDKNLDGYGSLEVITYDESEEAFKFRDVIFTKEARTADFEKITADEIEEKTDLHWISKVNPSVCMDCHSKNYSFDPKPIWDSYYLWPGVYGGIDDELRDKSKLLAGLSIKKEFDYFKDFEEIIKEKKHPRYKHLASTLKNRLGREANDLDRPNLVLGRTVNELMGRRAARQIYDNEAARRYRYMPFAFYGCSKAYKIRYAEFSTILFPNEPKMLMPSDMEELGWKLGSQDSKYQKDKFNRFLIGIETPETEIEKSWRTYNDYFGKENWCPVIGNECAVKFPPFMLYVLLRRFSMDLSDWYPIFDGTIPSSYDGRGHAFFLLGYLEALKKKEAVPEILSDFVNDFKTLGYVQSEKICDKIIKAARQTK